MKTGVEASAARSNTNSLTCDILPVLSGRVAAVIKKAGVSSFEPLEEIRLRADKPLMLQNYNREWFIYDDGSIAAKPSGSIETIHLPYKPDSQWKGNDRTPVFTVTQDDIMSSLERMSENSIYAYQDEIRNGYITIRGGHRVGITGRVIVDGGRVKNIRDAAGLNIRLSGQMIGCADKVMGHIIKNSSDIYNTLVISPPQCGKTTILRDMARILGDGSTRFGFRGVKVGIVDERSEIAACLHGIPQNHIGLRTDVLDGCPKSIGMPMLIRSMSPKVVITDEIGSDGDREAVQAVLNAGVRIVTSAHGYNISELKSRREVLKMMEDRVFERYIVLGNANGPGSLVEVLDGTTMKPLTGAGSNAV